MLTSDWILPVLLWTEQSNKCPVEFIQKCWNGLTIPWKQFRLPVLLSCCTICVQTLLPTEKIDHSLKTILNPWGRMNFFVTLLICSKVMFLYAIIDGSSHGSRGEWDVSMSYGNKWLWWCEIHCCRKLYHISALVIQKLHSTMQVMYLFVSVFVLQVWNDNSFIQRVIGTFPWHIN
jgi:hypothetical protein